MCVTKSTLEVRKNATEHSYRRGAGILTCCPSPTAFALGLGPANPGTICVAQETFPLRRGGFSPPFVLLMPTFSLPVTPWRLAPTTSTQTGMLPYHLRLAA